MINREDLFEMGMDELEQAYEEMSEDYEDFDDFLESNNLR